jgi:hypothetical protein
MCTIIFLFKNYCIHLDILTTAGSDVSVVQETIDVLTAKNAQLLAERETGNWISSGEIRFDSHHI